MQRYGAVVEHFDRYMAGNQDTWFQRTYPDQQQEQIIYFSAEYGLHEVLQSIRGAWGIVRRSFAKQPAILGFLLQLSGYFISRAILTSGLTVKDGRKPAFPS